MTNEGRSIVTPNDTYYLPAYPDPILRYLQRRTGQIFLSPSSFFEDPPSSENHGNQSDATWNIEDNQYLFIGG